MLSRFMGMTTKTVISDAIVASGGVPDLNRHFVSQGLPGAAVSKSSDRHIITSMEQSEFCGQLVVVGCGEFTIRRGFRTSPATSSSQVGPI
jgi:hypothetical protein